MKLFLIILLSLFSRGLMAQVPVNEYKTGFQFFWSTIRDYYCYWDKKQVDWNKVKTLYEPVIDTVSSKKSFVQVLEKVLNELYDHHASLNINTPESQRLVPSGADIWAEFRNGKAVIVEVRKGFGAENCGLRAGMQIVKFNDVPVEKAMMAFIPKSLKKNDIEAGNYALRSLLAGNHIENRKITINHSGKLTDYYPDNPVNLLETFQYPTAIESKILNGSIGYIRVNNRLGDNSIIKLFDSVLARLANTKALILDLRETPGGGNTTVARSIMGHFISKDGYYQKHELTSEETEFGVKRSWIEIVSPRKPYYGKKLIVLVNHWTGSVGEGITIGFDALKRATIIGTPMAGLNGANYSFGIENTTISFSFPAEKLFHVNGQPREKFKPHIVVRMEGQKANEDLVLKEALRLLR